MLRFERSGKSRGNTYSVGLFHHSVDDTSRVFRSHASDDEIDLSAPDLRLVYGDFANFDFTQISQAAPGGEFGFDGECDEDSHCTLRCITDASRCKGTRSTCNGLRRSIVAHITKRPPRALCAWRRGHGSSRLPSELGRAAPALLPAGRV